MVRPKYALLLLFVGCLGLLFGLASREIEREIGNFPILELTLGKGGIGLLKPIGISFLLFFTTLVAILVLTGTTTLSPSWVGWAYASLLPVGLFLYLRDQIGTIYGGLLFAAIMWHLGAVKKEIHLRIRFDPSLLGRGRSMVALVLLLVLLVPCYKGTGQLVETRGRVIQ